MEHRGRGVAPETRVLAARVRVTVPDWAGAIRVSCEPLVEGAAAERRYVDRCIALVEEHGPYVVVAPGVALAHARPDDGAKALGLAVATLTRPVAFGHPQNDPVDLVFAFASPDSKQHLGLLAALARRLSAGLGAELRAASTEGEAVRLLEEAVDDVARAP